MIESEGRKEISSRDEDYLPGKVGTLLNFEQSKDRERIIPFRRKPKSVLHASRGKGS